VLASKEEGAAPDALRFSLASDIVELVVLTADETFLHILREAVGDTRRLWHVPTADKVSDLLVAGEVGILVLDVQALNEAATEFVGQIKRQFPDLVVVAAGTRDAETSLAGLISSGMIYRFIHKPMSPGRARLFADAAVRKYEEQRRCAAAAPSVKRPSRPNRGLLIYAAVGVLGVIAVATWAFHRNAPAGAGLPESSGASQADGAPQAAAIPQADRGVPQAGDPLDPKARAGLSEVHERLLARAENALLEERLDEAAAAIETARKSGVENGRITFLTAQLAKSREQKKSAQARPEVRREAKAADRPVAAPLPSAAAANSEPSQSQAAARRQADMQAWAELLKNAGERLQQDRLIEPANDSAKYYLLTLRGLDPGNVGLPAAMQDLGTRLTDKARRALALEQYDAARSWLDEAGAVGFSSADSDSLRRGLDAASARRQFLSNVVASGSLELIKSTKPVYPAKAELNRVTGWVELDFTVAEDGAVKDIAVHASSNPGVFDAAAVGALSQWRYKPVQRDAKAVAQRARIRIRFALAD
jgi:TonB family protein